MNYNQSKKKLNKLNKKMYKLLLKMKAQSKKGNEKETMKISHLFASHHDQIRKEILKLPNSKIKLQEENIFRIFDLARNCYQQGSRDYSRHEDSKPLFEKRPELLTNFIRAREQCFRDGNKHMKNLLGLIREFDHNVNAEGEI
jgi:hypothetical protein